MHRTGAVRGVFMPTRDVRVTLIHSLPLPDVAAVRAKRLSVTISKNCSQPAVFPFHRRRTEAHSYDLRFAAMMLESLRQEAPRNSHVTMDGRMYFIRYQVVILQ